MDLEEDIKNTIISSIVSLFAHKEANSLISRTFPECKDIEHKNDCMRELLENV